MRTRKAEMAEEEKQQERERTRTRRKTAGERG